MYNDSYFVVDSNNNIIEEFDTQREAEEFVNFKARWGHDYDITTNPYQLW